MCEMNFMDYVRHVENVLEAFMSLPEIVAGLLSLKEGV
ncbi:MAG: hypothetical protein A4E54_02679 [Pelotomaculum sp. PtaB.Bin117]|nr:MAG: hypothetical protein A4E54_02679 [Pelotomaculum sp. PtaB.Bin117]OPY63815.1 MAG: hypothetical protein A4E56_00350 [Pelotomaculum sp. PtaU1.Bin065]